FHVDDQLVTVGALLNTSSFNLVRDLQHWGVNLVDRNAADVTRSWCCRNVGTATLNDEFHVQLRSVLQSCDVQVWVVDFHTSWRLNVASRDGARAFLAHVHNALLIRVRRTHEALNIQDDFGNVFLHTVDGGELVENTFDFDGSYCCTRDGRQQGTTHGVTDGVAEAWLQWFEDEP